MYLHIGNGKNIIKKNIIGIFDMDTSTVSSVTRKFIRKKEKDGLIEYDSSDIPKSFILLKESKGRKEDKLKGHERLKQKRFSKRKANTLINLSKLSSQSLKMRLSGELYYDYDVSEETT